MLAITFTFPVGRYHATPWGRHVNEADVAWPPEPWRILRALIASWNRKADPASFPPADLADLIDALAAEPPQFRLPEYVVHSHTRHYMPQREATKTTLVFDAFVRLPSSESLVAVWPTVSLDEDQRARLALLVSGIGYLGRAESWVEARLLEDAEAAAIEPNCHPRPATGKNALDGSIKEWDRKRVEPGQETVRVIAPLPAEEYRTVRASHLDRLVTSILVAHKGAKPLGTEKALAKASATPLASTLPERLVDAMTLDTAVLQAQGWSRPPASQDVLYARAALSPLPRRVRRHKASEEADLPQVARFVLAGRPRPRIEDTVKIGELMRLATLARYGWEAPDPVTGRRKPKAPPLFSGREETGGKRLLTDPIHGHAFWLSEDADGDGEIDHITVFARKGFDAEARAKLDSITKLWLEKKQRDDAGEEGAAAPSQRQEWRLALEGFGKPEDFQSRKEQDGGCAFLAPGRVFTSVTPFLAAGHLKHSPDRYQREIRRLLRLRDLVGEDSIDQVLVETQTTITVGGRTLRPLQFHRFRSTRGEQQHDTTGTFLKITLPIEINGPLCLGYGSHFGLGLFRAAAPTP